jgi:hypothetical protein
MLKNLLPRDFNLFDLFDKQVDHAVSAAVYFKELTLKGNVDESSISRINQIEHQADEVAHTIIQRLNKTFITPFDREDIYSLVMEVDDIVDMINTIASRLKIYNIARLDKNLVEFASIIEESVRAVSRSVKGLRNMKNSNLIADSCIEINRLENVGDSLRDKVLSELFDTEKDPIKVIKWKEIYEDAETVLDICEDVANVVEGIIVKQA